MIKYEQESFYDWFPEAKDLLAKNNAESRSYVEGLHWEIDVAWYKTASTHNALIVMTVRDNDLLVGYHVSYIGTNPHSMGTLFGFDDALYVHPDYRGKGVGSKLIDMTEKEWVKRGAKVGCMYSSGAGALHKKKGYVPCERLYMKILEA